MGKLSGKALQVLFVLGAAFGVAKLPRPLPGDFTATIVAAFLALIPAAFNQLAAIGGLVAGILFRAWWRWPVAALAGLAGWMMAEGWSWQPDPIRGAAYVAAACAWCLFGRWVTSWVDHRNRPPEAEQSPPGGDRTPAASPDPSRIEEKRP